MAFTEINDEQGMPLTRLGRQVIIGSTCVFLGVVFGGINYVVYEMSVNQGQ